MHQSDLLGFLVMSRFGSTEENCKYLGVNNFHSLSWHFTLSFVVLYLLKENAVLKVARYQTMKNVHSTFRGFSNSNDMTSTHHVNQVSFLGPSPDVGICLR